MGGKANGMGKENFAGMGFLIQITKGVRENNSRKTTSDPNEVERFGPIGLIEIRNQIRSDTTSLNCRSASLTCGGPRFG